MSHATFEALCPRRDFAMCHRARPGLLADHRIIHPRTLGANHGGMWRKRGADGVSGRAFPWPRPTTGTPAVAPQRNFLDAPRPGAFPLPGNGCVTEQPTDTAGIPRLRVIARCNRGSQENHRSNAGNGDGKPRRKPWKSFSSISNLYRAGGLAARPRAGLIIVVRNLTATGSI